MLESQLKGPGEVASRLAALTAGVWPPVEQILNAQLPPPPPSKGCYKRPDTVEKPRSQRLAAEPHPQCQGEKPGRADSQGKAQVWV